MQHASKLSPKIALRLRIAARWQFYDSIEGCNWDGWQTPCVHEKGLATYCKYIIIVWRDLETKWKDLKLEEAILYWRLRLKRSI